MAQSIASGEKYYAAGRALSNGGLGSSFRQAGAFGQDTGSGNAFEIGSIAGIRAAQFIGLQVSTGTITADQANLGAASGAASALIQRLNDREEKAAKQRSDDFMYQMLLDRLRDLENELAAKYGENFAEDRFAELFENGQIEEDEYKRIMAIEDDDKRRHAIAQAIQKGIDEGRIDPNDLGDDPLIKEWLDTHEKLEAEENEMAQEYIQDGNVNEIELADVASNVERQSCDVAVVESAQVATENSRRVAVNETSAIEKFQQLDNFSV